MLRAGIVSAAHTSSCIAPLQAAGSNLISVAGVNPSPRAASGGCLDNTLSEQFIIVA